MGNSTSGSAAASRGTTWSLSSRPGPTKVLIELFLLQDAIRQAGARRLYVVVPDYGYARQDRLFYPGEAVSARALGRHIAIDADAVVTVDLHSTEILKAFPKPVFEASGVPAVARACPRAPRGPPRLARQGRH